MNNIKKGKEVRIDYGNYDTEYKELGYTQWRGHGKGIHKGKYILMNGKKYRLHCRGMLLLRLSGKFKGQSICKLSSQNK